MANLNKLVTESGIISALAIDQRGALKNMLGEDTSKEELEGFKVQVSRHLTPYASSILLDPEYGLPAIQEKDSTCGLILAYEKTGYDSKKPGRLPDLIDTESVKRLKEKGADAIKLLIYIDVDESEDINQVKKAFVERVGSECLAQDLPLFLELVSYDSNLLTKKEYGKVKPRKVIQAMREFSDPRYNVAVLKVEVPVDLDYVEGYSKKESLFSKEEAAGFFREQSLATELPFIFLSAGVSADQFRETLRFAKESGSSFNGVLCGRATWAGGTEAYQKEGEDGATNWFQSQGKENIRTLADLVESLATPIY